MGPGPLNSITDVKGIMVGHFTHRASASGTTVVLCLDGAVAGVDVRGSAPGTRETDLLEPHNLVDRIQAVALCGGSVYGLAAADGVVRWLAERGFGFPVGPGQVAPIVPACVLFDLGRGKEFVPPVSQEWGYEACQGAREGHFPLGSVGAATGAVAGGIKGGIGTASEILDEGETVGAIVAVNSFGSPVDPSSGLLWELRLEMRGELGDLGRRPVKVPERLEGGSGKHTTLAVVATDVSLSKAQAKKIAQMAHDGIARAIRPSHTMFDGDVVFCLSTGQREMPREGKFLGEGMAQIINRVGRAAADCVARAIMRAMVEATSGYGFPALGDLPERV
jgi:L-aminopeptidase/D-esterase-like protein